MPSASGEFSTAGRSDFQSRLENGRRETGGIRREIRATQRCERRFFEEEETDADRDRPDAERALEHSAADKLPGVPPMKRIYQHPPEPATGKRYWRSLGEYSNTPEFREWLEREFPAGASELGGGGGGGRGFFVL